MSNLFDYCVRTDNLRTVRMESCALLSVRSVRRPYEVVTLTVFVPQTPTQTHTKI